MSLFVFLSSPNIHQGQCLLNLCMNYCNDFDNSYTRDTANCFVCCPGNQEPAGKGIYNPIIAVHS